MHIAAKRGEKIVRVKRCSFLRLFFCLPLSNTEFKYQLTPPPPGEGQIQQRQCLMYLLAGVFRGNQISAIFEDNCSIRCPSAHAYEFASSTLEADFSICLFSLGGRLSLENA